MLASSRSLPGRGTYDQLVRGLPQGSSQGPTPEKRIVCPMGTRYAKGRRHSSRRPHIVVSAVPGVLGLGTGLPWACWRAARRLAVAMRWVGSLRCGELQLHRLGGRLNLGHAQGCSLGFCRLLANGFFRERIKMPRYGQVRVAGVDFDCGFRVGKAGGGVRPIASGAF